MNVMFYKRNDLYYKLGFPQLTHSVLNVEFDLNDVLSLSLALVQGKTHASPMRPLDKLIHTVS